MGREAGGFSGVRLSWARNGIVTGRDGAGCGVRSLGKSLCETEFLFDGDLDGLSGALRNWNPCKVGARSPDK